MAHFIGNDKITLNSEKIVIIHWNLKDSNGLTYAEIHLTGGHKACLYFTSDDDFSLINDLRTEFGYEEIPRIR